MGLKKKLILNTFSYLNGEKVNCNNLKDKEMKCADDPFLCSKMFLNMPIK